MTATTSNYFEIALADDKAVETPSPTTEPNDPIQAEGSTAGEAAVKGDRAEARRQRIAAAVERSKTEYKPEHAYTELDHLEHGGRPSVAERPKLDRQRLEFMASYMYYNGEYESVVELLIAALDPKSLSRELLDTGIRAALKCHDVDNGVRLARLSKEFWRGQSAGMAVSAADALIAGSEYKEALVPVISSISSYGAHPPVVARLATVVEALGDMDDVLRLCHGALAKARPPKPLFPERPIPPQPKTQYPPLAPADIVTPDTTSLGERLGLDRKQSSDLVMTVRRLEKVIRGKEPDAVEGRVERGVREL